ncbi:MAG: ArnT family glycosyltransferase (plasmid) [Leptolyngbya sp. BL-A-14]
MFRLLQGLLKDSNIKYEIILFISILCVAAAHLLKLDSIPPSFFQDESSIAYNAALIAQTGKDEYNIPFPIYFKSFGDYKAPIYVYAVALIFKLFGISEFNSRFTSFIFYILALIFTLLLVRIIFKKNWIIEMYALITFGFLPQFFIASRVSFEVISQLTSITLVALLVKLAFRASKQRWWINSFICGVVLGVSVYTYPTARILTFLSLISLWTIYIKRDNIKKLVLITACFFASLIPYFSFAVSNSEALTARLKGISYLYLPISIPEKILRFLYNYMRYISPDFLIKNGDVSMNSLRNSTGYGGVVFSVTFILFLIGLAHVLFNKKLRNRFNIFLIANLIFAPVAGALTSDVNALRSILLGYYILIISCYGLKLVMLARRYVRVKLLICIFLILLFELSGYIFNYFVYYPANSIESVEMSFNFKGLLQSAVSQSPNEVLFIPYLSTDIAHLNFYRYLVVNSRNIPIKVISYDGLTKDLNNKCLLYYTVDQPRLKNLPYQFTEFRNEMQTNGVLKLISAKVPEARLRVRCLKGMSDGHSPRSLPEP